MFDRKEVFANRLIELVQMCQSPAWKAYAWDWAKTNEQDDSGLWTGISTELIKEMKCLKSH